MRVLGRILLLVASTLVVLGLVSWVRPWFDFSPASGNQLERATTSSFFPLQRDRWLSFDVPREADLFRVYAHAALSPAIGDRLASYSLDYEWLDEDGAVLFKDQYHITTRISPEVPDQFDASASGSKTALRFYDHRRLKPSRDHALYFSARSQPGARMLRLRFADADDGVEQVGIRAYQQHRREPQDSELAWQRMSVGQREDLVRGAVYPSFLLSDYERANLLSRYWRPVGPLGVLDDDYTIGKLYQLDIPPPGIPPPTPATSGLFGSPRHWLTLPLEAPDGRYRIEWLPSPHLEVPRRMQLLWQSADLAEQRSWEDAVEGAVWEGTLESGLLQVVPDRGGAMKLLHWQDGRWNDVTPERRYTRAYVCQPQAPLRYALAPGEEPQPIRLELRGFERERDPAVSMHPSVNLRLADTSGATVHEHALDLPTESHPYHHFADVAAMQGHVFTPVTRYIEAPAQADEIELRCNTPLMASVATRPWRHPLRRTLPGPGHHWLAYYEREPAWFSLQPENADELVRRKRYFSLLWYCRPVLMDGSLTADGDFSRESLTTSDPDAVEWQLFSPHEQTAADRLENLASSYRLLRGAQTVELAGSSHQATVRPSLVFSRAGAQPSPVQVLVDDRVVLETRIAGRNGRIRLPQLTAGIHTVEVLPDSVEWYLSHTTGEDRTHVMRRAYASLDNDNDHTDLRFEFATSGAEQQLSLWLYAPSGSATLRCDLALDARRRASVQLGRSFLDYRFTIDPGAYDAAQLLRRGGAALRGPVRISVPLREDLPAQQARLRVSCDQPGVAASAGLLSRGLTSYRYFEEQHDLL